ncbi:MAG: hypothetical protein WDW38_006777 [Sanguina aurantia]
MPCRVHKRFLTTTHAQRGGGFGQQQLEKAVRAINRIIFDYEARRTRLKAEAAAKGGPPVVEAPIRGQLVTFRASARHERMIKEPETDAVNGSSPSTAFQTSLRAYLALPLDQYSLLDPRWITRVGGAGNLFLLRVPLQDVVGLALEPQITVKVNIDSNNAQRPMPPLAIHTTQKNGAPWGQAGVGPHVTFAPAAHTCQLEVNLVPVGTADTAACSHPWGDQRMPAPTNALWGVCAGPSGSSCGTDMVHCWTDLTSQVHFLADKFKLGDPRFDEDFVVDMKATLKRKPLPGLGSFRLPRPWRRGSQQDTPDPQPQRPPTRTTSAPEAAVHASSLPAASQLQPSSACTDGSHPNPSGGGVDTRSGDDSSTSSPLNGEPPDTSFHHSDASHSSHHPFHNSSSSSTDHLPPHHPPVVDSLPTAPSLPTPSPAAPRSAASSTLNPAPPQPESRPHLDAAASSIAASGPGVTKGGPVVVGATSMLCGNVDVGFTVLVPHPLSIVPKPLLFMTGSLVARFALQSLLPSFLDLLAVDYSRWAAGKGADRAQPAGDLIVIGSGGSSGGAGGLLAVAGGLGAAGGSLQDVITLEGGVGVADLDPEAEVRDAVAVAAALEAEQARREAEQARSSDEEEEGFRSSDRSGGLSEAASSVSAPGMAVRPTPGQGQVMSDGPADDGSSDGGDGGGEVVEGRRRFPTRAAMLEVVSRPFKMFSRV